MKKHLLSLLALLAVSAAALAQTTTLTINSSTGLINVPAGVTPNFVGLRIGGTTIGSLYQPLDSDLAIFAGITPSSNVQSVLGAANYAAIKTLLGLNAVENTALSTWAGSTSLTTLGTVATGTWNATAIDPAKGGVPAGGLGDQVLIKASDDDYDVAWATPSGGGTAIQRILAADQGAAPAAKALLSGTWNRMPWEHVVADPGSALSDPDETGELTTFTAPSTGVYWVNAYVFAKRDDDLDEPWGLASLVSVNGDLLRRQYVNTSLNRYNQVPVSTAVQLSAGDTIEIYVLADAVDAHVYTVTDGQQAARLTLEIFH